MVLLWKELTLERVCMCEGRGGAQHVKRYGLISCVLHEIVMVLLQR